MAQAPPVKAAGWARSAPEPGRTASGNWVKRVAIRDHDRVVRLRNEFGLLKAALRTCPHVPELRSELLTSPNAIWFETEAIEGDSIDKVPNPPWDKIAVAIQALHELNVIHCDLKPEHIIVRRDGSIAILDYDLSIVAGTAAGNEGQFRGTNRYASTLAHLGETPNIGFDWESFAFMVLERKLAKLPWSGLGLDVRETGDHKLRYLTRTNDPIASAVLLFITDPAFNKAATFVENLQRPNHPAEAAVTPAEPVAAGAANGEAKNEEKGNALVGGNKGVGLAVGAIPKPGSTDAQVVTLAANQQPKREDGGAKLRDRQQQHLGALEGSYGQKFGQECENAFRDALSKALGRKLKAFKDPTVELDIWDLGSPDLFAKLSKDPQWSCERVCLSRVPDHQYFMPDRCRILIEIGAILTDQDPSADENAKTNLSNKMDQISDRCEKLLQDGHPLTILDKIEYMGIGIVALKTAAELFEKAQRHLARSKLNPGLLVLAALGRLLLLTTIDQQVVNTVGEASSKFTMVKSLQSGDGVRCPTCGIQFVRRIDCQRHLCDGRLGGLPGDAAIKVWDVTQVMEWASSVGLKKPEVFETNDINGELLLELTEAEWITLVPSIGQRKKLVKDLNLRRNTEKQT